MAILRRRVKGPRPPQQYDPALAARDAREIAKSYSLSERPLDVSELVAALGISVAKTPLDDRISGFLQRSGDGWLIGVNSLHHPNRQRFTLAHELGHYFLHRDKGPFEDELLFRKDNQFNPLEREANEFAALLLMPPIEFGRAIRHDNIETVARRFGVSKQAAEYRRQNIADQLQID